MKTTLDFGILSFVSLFTMVNPVGVLPVYLSMTAGLTPPQIRRTALKAVITALLILLGFKFTGEIIFDFFSISVNSLRIVGGVIFFIMGYEMLQARLSRTKIEAESVHAYVNDIALTPLAIPVICGPGAITSVIILSESADNLSQHGALLVAIGVVMGITYAALLGAERIMGRMGENGTKVMMRLMGLIVMTIAVEFFFAGLKPIIRDIYLFTIG